MSRYNGLGELALRVALWSSAVLGGLVVGSVVFLATREVLATIEAPRCVLDPSAQAWRMPPL